MANLLPALLDSTELDAARLARAHTNTPVCGVLHCWRLRLIAFSAAFVRIDIDQNLLMMIICVDGGCVHRKMKVRRARCTLDFGSFIVLRLIVTLHQPTNRPAPLSSSIVSSGA